jgi:hypothetical protein
MLFDEDGAGPATPITYRLITDHLGSVRLVVNAQTGAVAQRLRYDAYGRLLQGRRGRCSDVLFLGAKAQ